MPRPRPLPDALGRAFSVAAAMDAGVTERRLRHPSLDVPFRGARAAPEPAEDDPPYDESPTAREARLLKSAIRRSATEFAAVATEHCFFSHVTAAVLWGLPLPLRVLRLVLKVLDSAIVMREGIDVSVLSPRRAPKAAGVHGRELSSRLTTLREVDALRVADPASTWAMLASLLTVDELVRMGDAIVHIPRRRGMERGDESDALATLDELRAVAERGRRQGIRKLRAALELIRVGAASPGETDVRLACMRAGLPEPVLDFDVVRADGSPIGYTELAYPDWGVLNEYEGDHHRTDRTQWNRDIDKHAACVAEGWDVVRLTSKHVYPTAAEAVSLVRAALVRRGWRPDAR